MSNTLSSFAGKIAPIQGLLAATLVFGSMTVASAQTVTVPPTPTTITVPVGTGTYVGHLLDRQQREARSHAVHRCLRAAAADHHALPEHQ